MPKIFNKNQARFSFGFLIVRMCRVFYNGFLENVKCESDLYRDFNPTFRFFVVF